jgi:hypothetical protein
MLGRVEHERWRQVRAQWRQEQSDQLKMYRFRHKRERFLQDWRTAGQEPSSVRDNCTDGEKTRHRPQSRAGIKVVPWWTFTAGTSDTTY